MHDKFVRLDKRVYEYLLAHCTEPDDLEVELIERTDSLGDVSVMQVARDQAQLMGMLTKLSGARRAVEVGTFTGLSALAVARALPADGTLLCCDISEEWTAIAREFWQRAGVDSKIRLELAPAIDTLRALPTDEPIDIAFIDADKAGYPAYYEELITRMDSGGLLLLDNVLWFGMVADPSVTDDDTNAIRAFNDMVATDDRVEVVMLPVSDGLSLVRKR